MLVVLVGLQLAAAKSAAEVPLREKYVRDGWAIVSGFSPSYEREAMIERMKDYVESFNNDTASVVFRTDEEQSSAQGSSSYFLESADRVHFFKEEKGGWNKVGHGLHLVDDVFGRYSSSRKVSELLNSLGYSDPRLPQSMYIFKSARTGGAVTSHQDSSFLYTEPRQTVCGLWLALHDATLDNGCLWVRNASHFESTRRRFVRAEDNLLQFEEVEDLEGGGAAEKFGGVSHRRRVDWEGREMTASEAEKNGFVPVPVSAGDLVVFSGTLDHLSLPNESDRDRHTFQLHAIEGPDAGITWSRRNWLQTSRKEFMRLRMSSSVSSDDGVVARSARGEL